MKTSAPKLSILIATMGKRKRDFAALLNRLESQLTNEVEVVALWNNGERSIGDIRQRLLESAKGDYVCFVDDDDEVPTYYCAEILNVLGKDYIGFEVVMFNDGELMPRIFHSIRYSHWSQDENGYYRGVTHLNPIKREIALKGNYAGGAGEDERWSNSVRPYVNTENYIDKPMYYYFHCSDKTNFGGKLADDIKTYERPVIKDKHFRWCEL
jgi:glycosyltransferase involved in cell wall biosynthesis